MKEAADAVEEAARIVLERRDFISPRFHVFKREP